MNALSKTILWTILLTAISAKAQSYDERIADAMNSSDWFTLNELYKSAPKDSIMPFLEVYSRCLLGNRMNKPDMSIPAFQELYTKHNQDLNVSLVLSSAIMWAMDLSRIGDNKQAASLLEGITGQIKQHLDSATYTPLQSKIRAYEALSQYKPYTISIPEKETGKIPFHYISVGDKGGELMRLDSCSINNLPANITFDTGAGANIISTELARQFNLLPLDGEEIVMGYDVQVGQYAIASEIHLGNIIVKDVPFIVVDITTNNEEADKIIDCFNLVIGSELMLQLRNITIDFENQYISVNQVEELSHAKYPNMCFTSQMNLITQGNINGTTMLLNIDSGDGGYGTIGYNYYEANKENIQTTGTLNSVRSAGVGGIKIRDCYTYPDVELSIGGEKITVPSMNVISDESILSNDYECNLGLKSLRLYKRINFNMTDFVLTAIE